MDTGINLILNKFVDYIVNPAIYVLVALGLFIFVYGVFEFTQELSKGGDTTKGKEHMLWGTIGMFIMVSVFGIINVLNNTFGFGLGPHGNYNPDMSSFNSISSQILH